MKLPKVFYRLKSEDPAIPAAHATQARKKINDKIVPIILRTKPAVAIPDFSFFIATALKMIPTIPNNHMGKAFTPGIIPPTKLKIPKTNPATAMILLLSEF